MYRKRMKEVYKMLKYSELGAEVERLLKLRMVPIGIKLFEKTEDIPQDFDMMDSHRRSR